MLATLAAEFRGWWPHWLAVWRGMGTHWLYWPATFAVVSLVNSWAIWRRR